jgi:hypothetical protein
LNPYLKFAPTGKGVLLEPTNSARGLFATCTYRPPVILL